VIYIQESLSDAGKVFLDPNVLSDDGTTSVRQQSWSEDGSLLAYGLSEKGSDWVTVKFRQSPSGQDLADSIAGVKHSGLDWLGDNSGVFYSVRFLRFAFI
jgi:prolyl oligopeptidase